MSRKHDKQHDMFGKLSSDNVVLKPISAVHCQNSCECVTRKSTFDDSMNSEHGFHLAFTSSHFVFNCIMLIKLTASFETFQEIMLIYSPHHTKRILKEAYLFGNGCSLGL